MNYKLLALDLDGTTLGPNLNIDPAVSKAIAAAQAQGVRVTIATGRMFGSTVPYAKPGPIVSSLLQSVSQR